MIRLLTLIITIYISFKNCLLAEGISALDLYQNCKNYHDWVANDFRYPVDAQILFNMGKCKGIIETTGKTMLTLCYEKKRNLNVSNKMTANLKNIKTLTIVKYFVEHANKDPSIRRHEGHLYLMEFISKKWPCS